MRFLVEYKFFEPAFYRWTFPIGDGAVCGSSDLKHGAVDTGHHPQGTNVEQIVALLLEDARWIPLQQPQVRGRRLIVGRSTRSSLPDHERDRLGEG
jgi:hypothetical protein